MKEKLFLFLSLSILSTAEISAVNFPLPGKSAAYSLTDEKVTGKVIDSRGEPIIGVSVFLKDNRNKGTITDLDGNFTIDVPVGSELIFTYIGYKEQVVKVTSAVLNVVLVEDTQALDEVVVVGYGAVKKRDLTGSITSVKGDDIVNMTQPSVEKMLQGRVPGLQISQNSAQPGGGLSFLIRGASSVNASNAPLIVVDGFPLTEFGEPGGGRYDGGSKSSLNSLNPNDIESVEVLKDASATAIYGSRASNGVVLITTKKGTGEKATVEYTGNFGVSKMSDSYDVMNSSELMVQANRVLKETWMRDNKVAPYGPNNVEDIQTPFVPKWSSEQIANPGCNTDWLKEVTRLGMTTQHNVSVMRGGEKTKYLVSANYLKQDGVIEKSSFERFAGRINLDQKINDILMVGVQASASRSKNHNVPLGGGGNETSGVIRSAIQFSPMISVRNEDGSYPLNPEMSFMPNPVSLLEITDESLMENVRVIGYIQITPIKDLQIRASAGLDRNIALRTVYMPKTTLYGANVNGQANINENSRFDTNYDLTATYNWAPNDAHRFTFLLGTSYQKFTYLNHGASNSDFLIDSFLYYNLGAGAAPKPGVSSAGGKDETASYFGRVNYNFMDKYLFTATLRADGASNFAKNKKWGYFPSVAFAWRMINESFMEPITKAVSDMKLRLSYGQTGNSSIGSRAIALYGAGNRVLLGDSEKIGTYPSQLANPDLSWETSSEFNVGLDFGFFDQRLSGSVDYFNRKTTNLLATKPLMSYLPVNTINANIGATRSTGWEVALNSINIETKDWLWKTSVTFSRYIDRWAERAADWKPAIYEKANDYIRPIFTYLSDGLIKVGEEVPHMPGALPGQIKLKDIGGYKTNPDGSLAVDENGNFINTHEPDGKLDEADMVCLGPTNPGFTIGLNNTLTYKNFDLSVYFYGVFDRTMVNPLIGEYTDNLYQITQGKNFIKSWVEDMWTHDNQDAFYPSLFKSTFGNGDYYREKAWYIRCQNISLGYNVNKYIRLSLNADNLFVITPYSGIDPETDTYAASYPNARTFSFGVNVKF